MVHGSPTWVPTWIKLKCQVGCTAVKLFPGLVQIARTILWSIKTPLDIDGGLCTATGTSKCTPLQPLWHTFTRIPNRSRSYIFGFKKSNSLRLVLTRRNLIVDHKGSTKVSDTTTLPQIRDVNFFPFTFFTTIHQREQISTQITTDPSAIP